MNVMAIPRTGGTRIGALCLAAALTGIGVAGCTGEPDSTATSTLPGRWYTAEQVARGGEVFETNCIVCHGAGAVGDPNWRQRGADGYFPPPPLNGSAHAWHHPLLWLKETVTNGTAGGQGRMPAWGDQLSAEDVTATIAWFQSLWPEEVYAIWSEGNARYEPKSGG